MSNPTDDLNRLRDLAAKIDLAQIGISRAQKALEKPALHDAWNLNPKESERLLSNLEERTTQLQKLVGKYEALLEKGGRPESGQ
jgi:hypothetical protein